MRLMDTLLPSRWKESKKEKLLNSTSIHTGKVRGLAHSHHPYPLPPEFRACLNVSDKSRRRSEIGEWGPLRNWDKWVGHRFWGPLASGFIVDFYLLSVDTPWKVLKWIFFCSLSHIFIHHIVIEYPLCAKHCERD